MLVTFLILIQPCISGANITWSWCIIPVIYRCTQFADILLSILRLCYDKIENLFMIKTLSKLVAMENFLKMKEYPQKLYSLTSL